MNPQDIEKLLGGYATNTLTEDERNTLFAAALENQALFDALVDEQALRELLDDPPSRAHLLSALREDRESLGSRFIAWMRRPSAIALAAAVAAGVVMIAVIPRKQAPEKPAAVAVNIEPQKQVQMQAPAERVPDPKPDAPAPAGSPRRELVEKKEKALQPERDFAPPPAAKPAEPAQLPAPPVVAASPTAPASTAAPPPPAPMMAPPARSQFRATESAVVRQEEQSKLADAKTANAGGSASGVSARGLYYASRSSTGTLADKPAAGIGGNSGFGRSGTLARKRAAPEPAAPVIGGVRYSILRRGPDGGFAEVDPSTVFAQGDALRLRFETNQAGNLSVMERLGDGTSSLRLSARTQPGQPVSVPADGVIDVTAPGALRFLVRFSRNPRSEARGDQLAASAGLLRETASNSVFVVNPVAAADPVVDFELAINAR